MRLTQNLVLASESPHKGSNTPSSGVWWWMKKGWGQATGCGQSFWVSFSTLNTDDWVAEGHPALKNPISLIHRHRGSLLELMEEDLKGNWITQVHLRNGC